MDFIHLKTRVIHVFYALYLPNDYIHLKDNDIHVQLFHIIFSLIDKSPGMVQIYLKKLVISFNDQDYGRLNHFYN